MLQMGNLHKTLVEEPKGRTEIGIHMRGEVDNKKKRITETGCENGRFNWLRTEFGRKLL
jgi:hypothetical protein